MCRQKCRRWKALVVERLRLPGGGRGGVLIRPVRRGSVGRWIESSWLALRRRRMQIGTSRRPECDINGKPNSNGRTGEHTSRMPTQLSAMLTSRLSCAHFRAR